MKTLIVLGAGMVGVPITHYILQNAVPKAKDIKVILVTPNTDQYWNLASVRGIVPGQFSDDILFTPLKPGFEQYPKENWEIVFGKAESLEPEANKVVIATNDGGHRCISYDALVVATGSRARDDMPWKDLDTTEKTKQALQAARDQLAAAKTVVVAGGGTTGVETVGEIAFEYGGKKEIYFVIDKDLPLGSQFREDVRKGAKKEIERLGAKIITNARVTGVTQAGAGGKKKTTTLQLTKTTGEVETLETHAYFPTVGVIPNTSFVPKDMLDANGCVKQGKDLRVPGHKNLFVVGDAGNLEESTMYLAQRQAQHLVKVLETFLVSGEGEIAGEIEEYVPENKVVGAITLGRGRATGQMGTWKLYSLLVWWVKGRYLGTNSSKAIAAGKKIF
ncbi:FAD/NAD(P)-binding domain-containing protein [Sodiomyces alkalinus F11]|uniref:FAD/NAD(P)-binding domain-containing protein n=1 Tax=Sodiomyces alkalinus (strain CBS 110278 / VKM F-3762 / F11) TaxID=1314773 RepID=A0A3N2PXC6_SODAK|nr:FAD/NAD(P)-binding domain-containing protein [Sodiomyces alkalinus F11]ROT39142.1 FAD/NAD(P)-binding domain-containing protein [Sodiomyces alkalinus F11]